MTRTGLAALARLFVAGVALVACDARAQTPPAPARWVTDSAGFLSPAARQDLDAQLESYERSSGHHVLVWIARTTGDVPLEDYTVRAFQAWKVGRQGMDDGLVLFVFADDRKLRVEVGYGLEGQVPDAIASRVITETIVPRIQAGDRDGAIREGVVALTSAVEGRATTIGRGTGPLASAPPSRRARPMSLAQKLLVGLVVLVFLAIFVTNPSFAMYLLFSMLSGGRGGGSSGGGYSGGGYSGGGGRSGGGGASGSW